MPVHAKSHSCRLRFKVEELCSFRKCTFDHFNTTSPSGLIEQRTRSICLQTIRNRFTPIGTQAFIETQEIVNRQRGYDQAAIVCGTQIYCAHFRYETQHFSHLQWVIETG